MSDFLSQAILVASRDWAWAMWRACWQGGVSVIAVWLLCHALRAKLAAPLRPWLWRLAHLKFLLALAPVAPLLLPLLPAPPQAPIVQVTSSAATSPPPTARQSTLSGPRPQPPSQPSLQTPAAHRINPAPDETTTVARPLRQSAPRADAMAAFTQPRMTAVGFAAIIALLLWICGVLAVAARLWRDLRRTRRLLRTACPLDDTRIEVMVAEIAARMGVRRAPCLLTVARGKPLLIGWMRAAIVLPAPLLESCSEAEMRLILAHELGHHRHRDLGWNMLPALVSTLFWFHPLVWVARREWHLAQEMACDEMALRATGEAAATYGQMLLRLVRGESWHAVASLSETGLSAMGVVGGYSLLKRRLLAMKEISQTKEAGHRAKIAVAMLLPIAAAGLLPWRVTAQNTPQTLLKAPVTAPEVKAPTETNEVVGRVVAPDGRPVAGATIYWMRSFANRTPPLHTSRSDAGGLFRFETPRRDKKWQWAQLTVDAEGWGITSYDLDLGRSRRDIRIRLRRPATLRVAFRNPRGRAATGLKVRLAALQYSDSRWFALPPALLQRWMRRTDASGYCTFEGLPQGIIARLAVEEARFAPLSVEEEILLKNFSQTRQIQLLPFAAVGGRVTFGPTGKPVPGARVLARRINAAEARGDNEHIDRQLTSTDADAQGRYQLKRLRPGNYVGS